MPSDEEEKAPKPASGTMSKIGIALGILVLLLLGNFLLAEDEGAPALRASGKGDFRPSIHVDVAVEKKQQATQQKVSGDRPPPPSKTLLSLLPPEADKDAFTTNKLMHLGKIHWHDIMAASDSEMLQAASAFFFRKSDMAPCGTFRWIPRTQAETYNAWPLCDKVPQPPHYRCTVYSIVEKEGLGMEKAGNTELGCSMKFFTIDMEVNTKDLPMGVYYTGVGLSDHNDYGNDSKRKVATFATLLGMKKDQGRHMYFLKVNCRDCLWEAVEQIMQDQGADALYEYDHLFVGLDFSSAQFTPRRAMTLAALMFNQGFDQHFERKGENTKDLKGDLAESLLQGAAAGNGRVRGDELKSSAASTMAAKWEIAFHRKGSLSADHPFNGISQRWIDESNCGLQ